MSDQNGTFACPICGKDTPHYHSPAEQEEHREREAWVEESWQKFRRQMGWTNEGSDPS